MWSATHRTVARILATHPGPKAGDVEFSAKGTPRLKWGYVTTSLAWGRLWCGDDNPPLFAMSDNQSRCRALGEQLAMGMIDRTPTISIVGATAVSAIVVCAARSRSGAVFTPALSPSWRSPSWEAFWTNTGSSLDGTSPWRKGRRARRIDLYNPGPVACN